MLSRPHFVRFTVSVIKEGHVAVEGWGAVFVVVIHGVAEGFHQPGGELDTSGVGGGAGEGGEEAFAKEEAVEDGVNFFDVGAADELWADGGEVFVDALNSPKGHGVDDAADFLAA